MKYYLKILAVLYFAGGCLHILDLFDLRLKFSEMSFVWQTWIVYLMVADIFGAVGLWKQKRWGILLFWLVAASQLIAYVGFRSYFGKQDSLIAFHLITVALYFLISLKSKKTSPIDTQPA